MKQRKNGIIGFDLYYQEMFGDRWPILKEALLQPKKHIAIINPFADFTYSLPHHVFEGFNQAHAIADEFSRPKKNQTNLYNYYLMDAASILPSQSLEIKAGDKILDLCAAPGGKSLLCAFELKGSGQLVANDRSATRRSRLHRIFNDYLPSEVKDKILITSHDASRWSLYEQSAYDKILLDAPCSSERHVLENPNESSKWSFKRTKSLAITQFAMLASALEVVKVNGLIAYSTCALSRLENDGVIEKLHQKREGRFEILNLHFSFGNATKYGWEVLPDETSWGPFYLSLIKRLN